MGIFDRMGKVIQSNLNSLLDKAEDDKKLIELNLDEMDGQIKAGHQEVIQAVAAEKQLEKKVDDLQRRRRANGTSAPSWRSRAATRRSPARPSSRRSASRRSSRPPRRPAASSATWPSA